MEAAFESLRAAASQLAEHSDVAGASTQGSLAILELKQRNRELYEGLEAARTRTAAAKAALETTLLQLENLEYEKAHYQKEIRACREFTSEYTDSQIGLVDEAEFLRRAPPDLTSLHDDAVVDPRHQRMLNRLHFELAERQALARSLHELKVRKKALQDIITSRRTLVLSISTELKAVRQACAPLAQMLGAAGDRTLAVLLPAPLKHVFAAFDAVGAKRVTVTVLGSPDSVRDRDPLVLETKVGRRDTRRDGDDDDDTIRRHAADADADVHPLSVSADVLVEETGASLVALLFEWSPTQGVTVRVEHGPPDVLAHVGDQGDAGEVAEDGPGASSTAQASPLWLLKLAEGPGDSALAASVVDAICTATHRA